MPDSTRFDEFILAKGESLRVSDRPPASKAEWQARRTTQREAMFAAMGAFPKTPCDLKPEILGKIDREDYRIEKLIFQSQPDVWVTANLYAPTKVKGKLPAVLVVHGHWPGARRDPVVQARCLGLVQLGFVVLAVDAFGSGERYSEPARGTYHGALYGSTLWPVGQTLLGMQVYDNQRAVDYLLTRDEVDGAKIGITGASGGGNQSMYAGALDERIGAVVPVCSVGQYRAYLKAACCVCEVLPGALRFTEEGDVLGLVAPRALLVINASRDAFQFSPGEARKSIERARVIFDLNIVRDRIKHEVFESGHDYSKEMRETMYGWMVKWLKNSAGTGDGRPIPEPKITLETAEALACFPGADERPEPFLFPTTYAAREGKLLVEKASSFMPKHPEEWESSTKQMRNDLRKILGEIPKPPRPVAKPAPSPDGGEIFISHLRLNGEDDMPIPLYVLTRKEQLAKRPTCVFLHLDGKAAAAKHPLAKALALAGWLVVAPDLRATGDLKPAGDAIGAAPDHNSAEHALWIGRPLLGQWAFDVQCVFDWLAGQPNRDTQKTALVGVDQAGIVALTAAALFPDRVTSVAAVGSLASLITRKAYPDGTHMGLLAPGLLRVGDVPHLAAMAAPRRLIIADPRASNASALSERELPEAFRFTRAVYQAHKASERLTLRTTMRWDEIAAAL
jgi:dienelactone hydrolase